MNELIQALRACDKAAAPALEAYKEALTKAENSQWRYNLKATRLIERLEAALAKAENSQWRYNLKAARLIERLEACDFGKN